MHMDYRKHEYSLCLCASRHRTSKVELWLSWLLIEESLQYTLYGRQRLILNQERAMVALHCVHLNGFCADL